MAAEVRVAALVAGKPGIITIHTGIKEERLALLFAVIKTYGIRADTFIPTHVNRKDPLLQDQVFQLAEMGATADATCLTEIPTETDNRLSAADFACLADKRGLFDQLTFSSDAGGSMPRWDKDRKHIVGMGIGSPASLGFELNRLVNELNMDLGKALKPLTTTPARLYGLQGRKGVLAVDADADVLILEPSSMRVVDAVAGGSLVKRNGSLLKKGYFE
jgi:beta-aspartyl-dipeptidase (metallo-type)